MRSYRFWTSFYAGVACLAVAACGGQTLGGPAPAIHVPDAGSDAGGDAQSATSGSACPTGNKPFDLTFEGAHAAGVAVDDQYVYFTDMQNAVRKVPVCGGPVTTIALGQGIPLGIAVTPHWLYWINQGEQAGNGEVAQVPRNGTSIKLIASQLDGPRPIVHDATSVYFSTSNGEASSFPIGGGPVKKLADQVSGYACLAVDDAYVYYANYTEVGRVAKNGGVAEPLTDQAPFGWCVAVDQQWVYFTNYQGPLMRIAKTGGTPQTLSPPGPERYVTLDATDIYFTQDGYGGPAVLRIPKSGGKPQAIADGIGETGQIVVTDKALFWTDDAGLWRLDK